MASPTRYTQRRNAAPTLVSMQEAAQTVGVCVKTLRRWISDGRLTGYRLGPRAIRIDLDELLTLAHPLTTVGTVA